MLRHIAGPEIIEVSYDERLPENSSSKGLQLKWKHHDLYVKLNSRMGGYQNCEEVAEVLVSHFLKFTNITNYVVYYPCFIIEDGKHMGRGCYSKSFLTDSEINISFSKLFRKRGIKLDGKLQYDEEIMSDISKEIGVDLKDYLRKTLYLDAITSNTDRHLNNLSVIMNDKGNYREAPIFDNGLSCLMNFSEFSLDEDLTEAVLSIRPREFFKSYDEVCNCFGDNLIEVRKHDFISSVQPETKEEIRAFDAVKKGLDIMRGRTWKDVSI